ncbi:hypothetical protein V6N11_003344 [Hibiscus sabdariffa]|uniref:Uncharacterized protein n=1 Tax=Hibiscus sabdariffa TaxID=183260 RepID=A0ABR2SD81_9ROSI
MQWRPPIPPHQVLQSSLPVDTQIVRPVYEKMANPLVEEFLSGKSGMLAALRSTALARCTQFSVVPANLVLVHDVVEAELLIACALLRRYDKCQHPAKSNSVVLSIVDLAGAEREKRTGNQKVLQLPSFGFELFFQELMRSDKLWCRHKKSSTPLKLDSDDLMKENSSDYAKDNSVASTVVKVVEDVLSEGQNSCGIDETELDSDSSTHIKSECSSTPRIFDLLQKDDQVLSPILICILFI